jgi:hypothetical protein
MQRLFVLLTVATTAFAALAAPARADALAYENPREREAQNRRLIVAANLGTIDRGTTGTLVGFGYDATVSTTAGADVRLVFPGPFCERCFSHGLATGYTYSAGPTFGALHDAAFRLHVFDLAYAARVEFPCMRREHRRVHLTGLVGAAGMYADAGLGDVSRDDANRLNDRVAASQQYDHGALGWRVGLSLDFTFDSMLVGVGVDLRELYGLGAPEARTILAGAVLRIGFDVMLPHRSEPLYTDHQYSSSAHIVPL